MKVLLVDDDLDCLEILTNLVSSEGNNIEIITAIDGVEALKKIEQHGDVSIIVLDRMMPNMNGMELIEVLKNHKYYSKIPIIMQTASKGQEEFIEGAASSGIYYYLTKPFNKNIFMSVYRSALREAMNAELDKLSRASA